MIRVNDLEAALDFFCNKLGMIETRRKENEKGRFTLIFLATDEDIEEAGSNRPPEIELTYNWDNKELYGGGRNFGHLAFTVKNIYEICEKLKSGGVIINRPPRDGYMAFIKSPDGISLELLQDGDPLLIQEPWKSMENTGSW
tara:strand:- start:159 stop:584 length:426 start_codon:yes stop_codon:yes gene_type:complete